MRYLKEIFGGINITLISLITALLLAPGCSEEVPGRGRNGTDIDSEEEPVTGFPETGQLDDSTSIPYETPEGGPARFAFRSGEIEMEYIGIMNGVRRLHFDTYGLRERTFDSTQRAAERVPLLPTWSLIIMTPESYSILDLQNRKGRFGENETIDRYIHTWRESSQPLGELVLQQSGGERLPDTILLGIYPCRVWRQVGENGIVRTIYTHGGVPIGEAVTFGDDPNTGYRILPRKVRFGVEIPDSLFRVPQGFRMTPFESAR